MAENKQDIDPDTGYEKGRAERPSDLPFPDERIPTQQTVLEGPDGKGAFDDDVRPRTEDGKIENQVGEIKIPVSPLAAARSLAVDGVEVVDHTDEDQMRSGIAGDPTGLSNPTSSVTKDEDVIAHINTPVTNTRPNLASTVAPTSQMSKESKTEVDAPAETVTEKDAVDPAPATKLPVRDDSPTENVPVEDSTAKASSPEKTTTAKKAPAKRVRQ